MDGVREWVRVSASLWVVTLWACADPLDVVGQEEAVTESPQTLQDDDLADKNPEYDPDRTVQEEFSGCRVTLNKSASVTRLSLSPLDGEDEPLDGRVFPSRQAALQELGDRPVMPSMEVVNGALKPFNDGLYAAVELGADDGSSGSPIDKRQILQDLLAELVLRVEQGSGGEAAQARDAAAEIAAAIRLGGETPTAPAAVSSEADALVALFDGDPTASRPIGFYTWLPELEASFRRDRFLQGRHPTAPSFGAFAATALVLGENAELRARYQQMLDLYAGLTNPFHDYPPGELIPYVPDAAALDDLGAIQAAFDQDHPPEYSEDLPACSAGLAFLPASDSPEDQMMRRLLCRPGATLEGDLMDYLIAEIQSGAIDLTPTESSGWYDHQLYALETPLLPDLAPESEHLLLTREYKEKLVDTFRSIVTQNRETHVRQLEIFDIPRSSTSAEIEPIEFDIYPKLVVEPFPTFYVRTARAYRFLQGMLETVLGTEFLSSTSRVLEDGSRQDPSLGEELDQIVTLLYGLHLRAADSIGMAPGLSDEELAEYDVDSARVRAEEWLAGWSSDLDVNRDPRVIVPVAITKASMFFGLIAS